MRNENPVSVTCLLAATNKYLISWFHLSISFLILFKEYNAIKTPRACTGSVLPSVIGSELKDSEEIKPGSSSLLQNISFFMLRFHRNSSLFGLLIHACLIIDVILEMGSLLLFFANF